MTYYTIECNGPNIVLQGTTLKEETLIKLNYTNASGICTGKIIVNTFTNNEGNQATNTKAQSELSQVEMIKHQSFIGKIVVNTFTNTEGDQARNTKAQSELSQVKMIIYQ